MTSEPKRKSVGKSDTPSRAEFVYCELKQAIADGIYLPGKPVRETEVAARLGVSRTPVREAFRRLQTDGILEFTPWRGVIVAELNEQQILELYCMRKVLEGTAAALAATNASPDQIDELDTIMRKADGENDPEALADLNREFHQALFDAANNRYLLHAISALRNPMALLSKTTYSVQNRPESAQNEHRQIIDAIKRRDAEAAEKLGYGHIANAEQARFKLLNRA